MLGTTRPVNVVSFAFADGPAARRPMASRWNWSHGLVALIVLVTSAASWSVQAQDTATLNEPADSAPAETDATPPAAADAGSGADEGPRATAEPTAEPTTVEKVTTNVEEAVEAGKTAVTSAAQSVATTVDKSTTAKKVTAGILDPIYVIAESLSFEAFHWIAFTLMTAGVVSYALQLVIGKLVVLTRLYFSLGEVLSDLLGLVISVLGLVLTTQAAAENSQFTQSPALVLSAAIAGALVGLQFYLWGQSQELAAARGSAKQTAPAAKK